MPGSELVGIQSRRSDGLFLHPDHGSTSPRLTDECNFSVTCLHGRLYYKSRHKNF